MEPLICAILKPVMHDSVGRSDDLQGILLVLVNVPHTVEAWALLIGMIEMIFMVLFREYID
jgi:hypothetical protein